MIMGKGSTRLQPVQFSIPVELFVTDSLSARCLKVHARTRALSRKTKMPDSNVGLLFRAWPTPERGGNLNLECISYQTWAGGMKPATTCQRPRGDQVLPIATKTP